MCALHYFYNYAVNPESLRIERPRDVLRFDRWMIFEAPLPQAWETKDGASNDEDVHER